LRRAEEDTAEENRQEAITGTIEFHRRIWWDGHVLPVDLPANQTNKKSDRQAIHACPTKPSDELWESQDAVMGAGCYFARTDAKLRTD
jgi:hypothetical protein